MAGAVELATAYIALVPSLKGASQGISSQLTPASATAGAEGGASLGSALMGGLSKFAVPIAGVVAAFSVGKLIKDSVKDFQDYQGAVNGFGRIAGGTTQQYSGLREAIKLSGVDVDAASGGLTIFSKNLGNAAGDASKSADMAKKLGTDFKDAAGNVKPMSEIMPGLADKFKAMPDGAEKTALAMSLFGRSGAQMLPFLNQGSAGIEALTAKAGKMGLILDDTDKKIFAASKAGIREYQESVKGLHVAIGSTALPVLTAFGNVGRSITVPVIQALAGAMSAARGPAMALAGHIQALADRMRMGVEGVITLLTKGQFTGGLRKALGLEEDSKIVGVIIDIREGVVKAFGAIKGAVSGVNLKDIFADLKPVFEPVLALFHQLAPVIAPLLPQIMTLATSFSPLHLIFSALAPVLPQIGAALGQLAEAIGPVLGAALTTVVPVLVQLASVIVGSLGAAVQAILPSLIGLIPLVVGAFTQLLPVIAGLIVQLVPLIASLLPPLIGLFVSLIPVVVQVIAAIVPLVVTLVSQLVPIFVQLIQQVLPPLVGVFGALITAVLPLILMFANMLIPIIQMLMPIVVMVFGVIANVITAAMQIVMGIIEVVTGIISGNWAMVWDGILNIFGGIWNTIVAVVGGVLGVLWSVISGALSGIGSFIGSILGNIGQFFADTWNNITNGVGGFIDGFIGFFNDLPGKIMAALGDLGGLLISSGQALIQGFIKGIQGMVGAIGDAVGGVLDVAKQFFPHSPAKRGPFSGSGYTSFSGQALAKDFAKGIASQNDLVADAAAGIMTSASLTGRVGISSALQNTPSGRSGTTFNTTINQVDDPIGTAHAVTRRQLALSS